MTTNGDNSKFFVSQHVPFSYILPWGKIHRHLMMDRAGEERQMTELYITRYCEKCKWLAELFNWILPYAVTQQFKYDRIVWTVFVYSLPFYIQSSLGSVIALYKKPVQLASWAGILASQDWVLNWNVLFWVAMNLFPLWRKGVIMLFVVLIGSQVYLSLALGSSVVNSSTV